MNAEIASRYGFPFMTNYRNIGRADPGDPQIKLRVCPTVLSLNRNSGSSARPWPISTHAKSARWSRDWPPRINPMAPLQYGGGVCGAGSPVEPGFGMANSMFIGCIVSIMGLPQARNWPMTPLFKLNCARLFLFRTNYCWRFVDRCLKSSPDGWLQTMAR